MAKKAKKATEDVEFGDEHRVFSHLMYLLFLVASALAAFYTFNMLFYPPESGAGTDYNGIKSLVFLAWAFLFKTLGHRIHPPHY